MTGRLTVSRRSLLGVGAGTAVVAAGAGGVALVARDVAVTSNAAKCSRSWAGVTMPAWWWPWNG